MRKRVLKLLTASLCISALIGIFIILTGNFGELAGKVLGTTSSIFAFSIAGLCCSALYEKEKYKFFSVFGMLTALSGCIWLILIIWGFLDFCIIFCSSNSDFTWRMLWTLIVLAYSSAHISLMLLIKNQNSTVVGVKNFTILFSAILDIMILVLAWDMMNEFDFYGRLVAVLAILVALGTIVAPILNKVYKDTNENQNNNNTTIAYDNVVIANNTQQDIVSTSIINEPPAQQPPTETPMK